jgi:hypothetical protein
MDDIGAGNASIAAGSRTLKYDFVYKPFLMNGKPARLLVTGPSSDMPGILDAGSDPALLRLYNHAFEIGKVEGKTEILLRQMRYRFGTPPETAIAAVLAAQPADLDLWADAIFEAESLDGLLSRRAVSDNGPHW